jgi:hypothetical protein
VGNAMPLKRFHTNGPRRETGSSTAVPYEATQHNLGEQRRFVLWWDEQDKQHGKLGDRSATQFTRLDDVGLNKETVSRWRKKLNDRA